LKTRGKASAPLLVRQGGAEAVGSENARLQEPYRENPSFMNSVAKYVKDL